MTPTEAEAQKWEKIIKERNAEFLAELRRTSPSMRFGSPFDTTEPRRLHLVESIRAGVSEPSTLEGHSRILLAKAA